MALTETLEQNALDKIDSKKDSVSLVPGGKNVNGTFVANVPKPPKLPAPELTPVNTIDASQLSTASAPLSSPTPTSSDYQEFQTFLSSVVPQNTALADRRNQLSSQIRSTMQTVGQKGARQQALEAEAGIPESMTQLQELNTTIANLTKSYGEAIVNEEGVARPQEFITGRQDFMQKKKTAEVEALTAVAEALQGNITLAEDAAEKAVNFEFADEEAELETLWFEFNANKDDLTREDTKGAKELENYIGERARILGEKKAERAGAIAIAQEAALNGAPSDLISRIAKAATQEEALALGGQYIGLLERQAKLQSISASRTSQLLALAEAGDPGAISSLGFDPRSIEVEIDPTTRRQLEAEVDGTTELLDLAKQYRDLIATEGFTNTLAGDPAVLGQIESLRAQITASYKKAETLGTLDAGVMTLMNQLLGESPTSTFNVTKNATGRPAAKLVESLDTFIETTEKAQSRSMLRLGLNPIAMDVLKEDDLSEIDEIMGITGGSTAPFNPANFY
jgi:hypothetical protein